MASALKADPVPAITAQCDCAGEAIALLVTALTPEHCEVEARGPWHGECDFLRLVIAGRIHINGHVTWRRGARAGIRFFGQLHPVVVDELLG